MATAWTANASDTGAIADCDAAEHARVVVPAAADDPAAAAAAWLDARTLRWAGAPGGARYRLYASASATLRLDPDGRVRGFDRVIELAPTARPNSPEVARTFSYLGAGVTLALPTSAVSSVPELLRRQLWLVREDAHGRALAQTRVQAGAALDDLYADAAERRDDFGVRRRGDGIGFVVWAPTARAVAVCLYPSAEATATHRIALHRGATDGSWQVAVQDADHATYYTYLVDVPVPGLGIVRNRVTDPYSISLDADARRSYVGTLDDAGLQPPGWPGTRPAPPARGTDLAIYELHVRDFSASDGSVPAAERGKYLAFTETGSAGMRHLRALAQAGLTDVHLLPVFDFGSVPERGCVTPEVHGTGDDAGPRTAIAAVAARDCFNWGYDPMHFGAPEGSYASAADDGAARVREFRAMVMALHAIGLRVGMDVVYNHTWASGQDPRSVLDRIVPGYYHRLDALGRVTTSTCCANTATEHRMMAKLMADTVLRWARDYGIDSFRFDLMGHQPRAVMESLQARLRRELGHDVPLIGEGWNFGEVADGARFVQASQLSLNDSGIATFNDRLRDALRGGGAGDGGADLVRRQGYINGLDYDRNAVAATSPAAEALPAIADRVRAGLAGSLRDYPLRTRDGTIQRLSALDYHGQPVGYASAPDEVVNYVENHDNQTLFDTDALKLPRATSPRDRARVQLLGVALVMFSQGIPYFHAGVDLLRSKSLDRNSYDSGDWFNRLDWRGQHNNFAVGLPPGDTADDDAVFAPVLRADRIAPAPADIDLARAWFRDLLRIRASTPLFRLPDTDSVRARLRFDNTGPDAIATVIAGHLDGRGYSGAGFDDVLYLVNVDVRPQQILLPDARGVPYRLHPVLAAADAADAATLRAVRFDPRNGEFTLPPRSVAVFVTPSGADAPLPP